MGLGLTLVLAPDAGTPGFAPSTHTESQRITDPAFDSSTGWTLGGGWTIAAGKLSTSNTNGNADFAIGTTIPAGVPWSLSIDCDSGAAAGVTIQFVGGSVSSVKTLNTNGAGITASGTTSHTVTTIRIRRFGSGSPVLDNFTVTM